MRARKAQKIKKQGELFDAGGTQRPRHWSEGMKYAKALDVSTESELLDICADVERDVVSRGIACLALGYLEHAPASPVLVNLANDTELHLVNDATRALEIIRSPESFEPMMRLAANAERTAVRNRAIAVLGALGNPNAEGLLLTILANRDEDESTRCEAVEAIGTLAPAGPRTTKALLSLLHDHSALIRWSSLNALGTLGDQSAVREIREHLSDSEVVLALPETTTVASAAANALQNLSVCRGLRRS